MKFDSANWSLWRKGRLGNSLQLYAVELWRLVLKFLRLAVAGSPLKNGGRVARASSCSNGSAAGFIPRTLNCRKSIKRLQ
ncbi:unnamed protein product, partial [Nesidiocoris tenuis]